MVVGHRLEVNSQMETCDERDTSTEIETRTESPFFSRLPYELREKVFMLLFANKDQHTVYRCISPRSGQLLQVCKRMHSEASPVLYKETAFEYLSDTLLQSDMTNKIPALSYRPFIRKVTLELYEYMARHLDEYPGLQNLTILMPRFLHLQAGIQAKAQARSSQSMRFILEQSKNMPRLEVAIEGECLEFKNGEYVSLWRRRILKKAIKE